VSLLVLLLVEKGQVHFGLFAAAALPRRLISPGHLPDLPIAVLAAGAVYPDVVVVRDPSSAARAQFCCRSPAGSVARSGGWKSNAG
jgi:hypothetical protein